MNNHQASWLHLGHHVRRKVSLGDAGEGNGREVLIVEHVEPPKHYDDTLTVHAGGHAFKAWEIERVRDTGD